MNEQEKHIGIWAECLHILGNIVEPQQFDTWFKPVRPVSFQGSTLTIEVPTHFYREYLEDAFLDVLKFTLKPEKRKLVQDLALVGNTAREDHIERADAVGDDHEELVPEVEYIADLAAFLWNSRNRAFQERMILVVFHGFLVFCLKSNVLSSLPSPV